MKNKKEYEALLAKLKQESTVVAQHNIPPHIRAKMIRDGVLCGTEINTPKLKLIVCKKEKP